MPVGSRNVAKEAREKCLVIPISFVTGEQVTGLRVYPPPATDWKLVAARYEVTVALAGTDAGLVDIKDDAGDVAVTQLSIPLSSAVGTRGTFVLNTTERRMYARSTGASGENTYHAITVSKATAGGEALLFLYYRAVGPNRTEAT